MRRRSHLDDFSILSINGETSNKELAECLKGFDVTKSASGICRRENGLELFYVSPVNLYGERAGLLFLGANVDAVATSSGRGVLQMVRVDGTNPDGIVFQAGNLGAQDKSDD